MGNILVVDDERSIRLTVKAFLEDDGHFVETAEEAESALTILHKTPMDVVLTDIILPRVSGVDLLRQIRNAAPRVQVIMMTGEPTLETAAESLRHGAVDYLQKPVGKKEILKAIRNALHIKHLSDERLRLEEESHHYMNRLEQLVEMRTHALEESEAALRRRAEELSMLNRLARAVNESITVEDSIQCGLREVVQAIRPDLAVVLLVKGVELEIKGVFPERLKTDWQPTEPHRLGKCLCGLAVSEGKSLYSTDISSDYRCSMQECLKAGFCSFAALPLRSGPEIIGVLGMASLEKRNFQEDVSLLEALANEMAIGLNKSLLYEQVRQHATELKASISRIEAAEAEHRTLMQHLQKSQKLEAIGTLASGIAHDFNNILAVITGYAELSLLDIPNGSKTWKKLQMVLNASERAKDLINQILAFSRQSEEERRPIQIAHVVKEVLKFIRASLPATIEIRQRFEPNIGNVLADPVQIHQVLMNLCTNAHHAMQEKGGVLEVGMTSVNRELGFSALHPDLRPGSYIRITVKDSGCGMDEDIMQKIFDPYFTTKGKGTGTGLGLAVAHGIVQKHGGTITVESKPGEGALFNLYLPVIEQEAVEEKEALQNMPTGHERILLVDDEQVLLDMSKEMLEQLGYRVEIRSSSMEALALFRSNPDRFDLVMTDMTMPNMTGDRLATELLRARADIPIVVCTGYSEKITDKQAEAIGISAFVMKPLLMAKLAETIRGALDNKRSASPVG